MINKRKQSAKEIIDSSGKKSNFFAFIKTRQAQTISGTFLILFSAFLCIAFISFFYSWQVDQSSLTKLTDRSVRSENLLGKIGANLSHFFIYKEFWNWRFYYSLTDIYIRALHSAKKETF